MLTRDQIIEKLKDIIVSADPGLTEKTGSVSEDTRIM